jgi:hypothetical protein
MHGFIIPTVAQVRVGRNLKLVSTYSLAVQVPVPWTVKYLISPRHSCPSKPLSLPSFWILGFLDSWILVSWTPGFFVPVHHCTSHSFSFRTVTMRIESALVCSLLATFGACQQPMARPPNGQQAPSNPPPISLSNRPPTPPSSASLSFPSLPPPFTPIPPQMPPPNQGPPTFPNRPQTSPNNSPRNGQQNPSYTGPPIPFNSGQPPLWRGPDGPQNNGQRNPPPYYSPQNGQRNPPYSAPAGRPGMECGKDLPPCPGQWTCKKLSATCLDLFQSGSCRSQCAPPGVAAPAPKLPAPKSPSPKLGGPRSPGPKSPLGAQVPASNKPLSYLQCPSTMRCQRGSVCIPSMRTEGAYMCITPDDDCGNVRLFGLYKNCPAGKVCVTDPRQQW